MKHILVIISLVLVAGCSTVPVPINRTFPVIPVSLQTGCPELQLVDTKTDKLSEVLTVVTINCL